MVTVYGEVVPSECFSSVALLDRISSSRRHWRGRSGVAMRASSPRLSKREAIVGHSRRRPVCYIHTRLLFI